MLNQTWQSDFTHYRLATGVDVEIIKASTTAPATPCNVALASARAGTVLRLWL